MRTVITDVIGGHEDRHYRRYWRTSCFTELLDILNVREKIDDNNSKKSLPVKKRKIENVTVENNEIEK
jgi:hypothetical protein